MIDSTIVLELITSLFAANKQLQLEIAALKKQLSNYDKIEEAETKKEKG